MIDHYTYRVIWAKEDGEYVGLCSEFPSLSWLEDTHEKALAGIKRLVRDSILVSSPSVSIPSYPKG